MNEHEVFSALSNATRRRILAMMKDIPLHFGGDGDEVCVSVIQKKIGLSQSTVSAYMASLERAGLVCSERRGQWTYFRRDEGAVAAFAAKITREL